MVLTTEQLPKLPSNNLYLTVLILWLGGHSRGSVTKAVYQNYPRCWHFEIRVSAHHFLLWEPSCSHNSLIIFIPAKDSTLDVQPNLKCLTFE